jgi:hypothetical protein
MGVLRVIWTQLYHLRGRKWGGSLYQRCERAAIMSIYLALVEQLDIAACRQDTAASFQSLARSSNESGWSASCTREF